MKPLVLAFVALVTLAAASCGSRAESSSNSAVHEGDATCNASAAVWATSHDKTAQLAASFIVPASGVVNWQETRNGPNGPRPQSKYRALPAGEQLTVCFYDGVFTGYPSHRGVSLAPYRRMVVIVTADGTAELDMVGPTSSIPLVRPQ